MRGSQGLQETNQIKLDCFVAKPPRNDRTGLYVTVLYNISMYYFYLFECRDGSFYAGSTKDLEEREKKHNSGKGAIYTRTHGGGKIIYFEKFATWGEALRREAEVKKWRRSKKLTLINESRMPSDDN